ncbi:MAG: DNA polymerase II [Halioglobus sp.]
MTARTFDGFLLTRHWRDTAEGLELRFWFATAQGPVLARVQGERSVFFLADAQLAQAATVLSPAIAYDVRSRPLRNFACEPVSALYFQQYREARRAADALRAAGLEPLEADINPADRFLMERFVAGSARLRGTPLVARGYLRLDNPEFTGSEVKPPLAVASFDIETAVNDLQLYSIAVHAWGREHEERRVFMLGGDVSESLVTPCVSQDALLDAFFDWLETYDPDVLIGWNVINFDTRFLQRLCDRLGRTLTLGRDRAAPRWRELDEDGQRFTVQIPGRVILDGIELLRAAFYRFESFSLENVARELLGEGKLLQGGDRGAEITRLFHADKASLARYNLKDCELVSEIFRVTRLLDFAVARSVMTGLNSDRLGGSVATFDNLYLPRLHRKGFVAPNAASDHAASPGGFVLDSSPGIYEHVLLLDFKSLYPSIIRTFFIDPLGLALGLSGELTESATVEGFNGARFAREGHILPGLIEQLWRRRDAARASGDQPLSQAIKIIMNSFYGVLGTPGCRFFDSRLASSITRRGHEILTRTRDRIEASGYRVIYGDTDSVFVWVPEAGSDAEAAAAGRALQADLNAWWREELQTRFGLESVLELEFETHYRRFLMPTVRGSDKGSKKRYAGVVADASGEERLVFKGLENVRTD